MDSVYIWMIVVFLAIVYFDYRDKQITQEGFENIGGFNKNEPYFQERNLVNYTIGDYNSSVNFNLKKNNIGFKNFGTNGVIPPYLKCPMCKLQFDCTGYPYDISEKEGNVCTTCMEKIYLDEYNFPVLARANGRPRVCRDLR